MGPWAFCPLLSAPDPDVCSAVSQPRISSREQDITGPVLLEQNSGVEAVTIWINIKTDDCKL